MIRRLLPIRLDKGIVFLRIREVKFEPSKTISLCPRSICGIDAEEFSPVRAENYRWSLIYAAAYLFPGVVRSGYFDTRRIDCPRVFHRCDVKSLVSVCFGDVSGPYCVKLGAYPEHGHINGIDGVINTKLFAAAVFFVVFHVSSEEHSHIFPCPGCRIGGGAAEHTGSLGAVTEFLAVRTEFG